MRYRALLGIISATIATSTHAVTDQERTVLKRLHSDLNP